MSAQIGKANVNSFCHLNFDCNMFPGVFSLLVKCNHVFFGEISPSAKINYILLNPDNICTLIFLQFSAIWSNEFHIFSQDFLSANEILEQSYMKPNFPNLRKQTAICLHNKYLNTPQIQYIYYIVLTDSTKQHTAQGKTNSYESAFHWLFQKDS